MDQQSAITVQSTVYVQWTAATHVCRKYEKFSVSLKSPANKAEEMNRIIIDYVNGGERMLAQDKLFLQKELGGYGLVDLYKMDIYVYKGKLNPKMVD